MNTNQIPESVSKSLSEYGPVVFDSYCGEPISWGHRILYHLGEEKFNALRQYGELDCVSGTSWVLVRKRLEQDEAVRMYGKVTEIERGPRGGFRSVTFGKTKFLQKYLAVGL